MKCGRGPKGPKAKKLGVCPAASERILDRVHGGINSGRACWVVAGTFCGGTAQGSFARKQVACKRKGEYNQKQTNADNPVEFPGWFIGARVKNAQHMQHNGDHNAVPGPTVNVTQKSP